MDEVDPALAHAIEEAILFGKQPEMAALLDQLSDETRLPDTMRHDLESLAFFRMHYQTAPSLTDGMRQQVARTDAEWTMALVQRLHQRTFGVGASQVA